MQEEESLDGRLAQAPANNPNKSKKKIYKTKTGDYLKMILVPGSMFTQSRADRERGFQFYIDPTIVEMEFSKAIAYVIAGSVLCNYLIEKFTQ